jgi:queuine tRNA-ribosyltransferase
MTAHGPVETPVFMPVGTQATVKGLLPDEVRSTGASVVLSNTYHLWLRPSAELIERAGGLHQFMGWDRAILTDSGGFQVFSLAHLVEIDDGGVAFVSHVDGQPRTLTPELAMEVQAQLGSDIAMQLDVCSAYPASPATLHEAADRTHRWAHRCLAARHSPGQLVFGIVQGGTDPGLRAECAATLGSLPFDGFGIGGMSVGEPRTETWPAVEAACRELPAERPRYLMGVGAPGDLIEAIARGVDMFDCVLPTRLGRHGAVLTPAGQVDLRKVVHARRNEPIDSTCDCPTCTQFTVDYLHHLIRAEEDLGRTLMSIHNIRYLTRLAQDARLAILEGRFAEFRTARGST